ncbi:MAG: NHLP leader peptide family natural product precursor [Gemmatimonadetes bacterium]|nr:MAG: NHLP leader peptide family natural product precursor [Gemmatimonadota bacterium]
MASKREIGLVQSAGKVIAKAWRDEAFKKRLVKEPLQVLRAEGVELPEGVRTVRVVEDGPELRHLILPVKPPGLRPDEIEAEARQWCSLFWCSA